MSCTNTNDFIIKRHDTLPKIQVTISNFTNGDLIPVDLTGATASFIMVVDNVAKDIVINAPATITNALLGKIEYTWVSSDTDESGRFLGEFEIIFPTGKRTVPNDNSLTIKIVDDFDNQ